jgi:4-amino-4-deoxy-L-arabinose transferase-like glycosyltransferase
MVFLSLASIAFAVLSIRVQQQRKYGLLFLSAIFAALALLVKPFAIFLLIPLPYLFLLSLGITWVSLFVCIISFAISVVPLFLWREWITRFPEGIPVFTWLFNEGNIRFKGAWFHWLFAERLSKLILGYFGVVLFVVGIIRKKDHKEELFYLLLLIGGLAYIIIIARGNVQHDYYQIPLLPLISLYLGKGFEWFIRPPKDWTISTSRVVGVIIVLFVLAFSWFEIRGFYWINHPEIVEAGKAANSLIPKDAKVIAPYNGDTSFLYQTNRQGWPIGFEIDKKISQGATFYVTVSPSDADGETKDLATRYTVVVRNDRFAIIDLTKPKILP